MNFLLNLQRHFKQYTTDQMPNDTPKASALPHGRVAKLLHWSSALLLLYAYIRNGDVTNALHDSRQMKVEIWFGLFTAALFGARYVWMQRFNHGASRLAPDAPKWQRRLSKLAHYSIYAGVGAIVITGLLIPAALEFGRPFIVDATVAVHVFISFTVAALIATHIFAALYHKLLRRDGIWESIGTPWFRRPGFLK